MENRVEDYDNIPVTYCKRCLSLRIITLNDDMDYCDECGNTDMGTTDIHSWRKMYKETYGKDY